MALPTVYFILRTQCKRMPMFVEALRSIEKQICIKKVLVVNHSNTKLELSKAEFPQLEELMVLDLPDLNKKRGAPLNLGLKYILEKTKDGDGFAFLDDDDIFYPQFVQTLINQFSTGQHYLAYGSTMKRNSDGTIIPAFGYKPDLEILVNNFLPINSYLVNLKEFRKNPILLDENLSVLEDWYFLIQIVQNGYTFKYVDANISEFRLHGDGSGSLTIDTVKQWELAEKYIQEKIETLDLKVSNRSMAEFVASLRDRRATLRKIVIPENQKWTVSFWNFLKSIYHKLKMAF